VRHVYSQNSLVLVIVRTLILRPTGGFSARCRPKPPNTSELQCKTFVRTIGFLSFALLLISAVVVSADESRLVIRIYDTGAASTAERAAAIRTAAAIVQGAGFLVDWRDCSDRTSAPGCEHPRRDRDLIVRIMPASSSVPGNSVEAGFGLGVAVLDPSTRAGEMATVYHDRVEAVAHRTRVDCGELLGRALAHEVGHLLLRELGHSRTGLMRAGWTDAEIASNRREDWVFARQSDAFADAAGTSGAGLLASSLYFESSTDVATSTGRP
jgi:hypothetical protein